MPFGTTPEQMLDFLIDGSADLKRRLTVEGDDETPIALDVVLTYLRLAVKTRHDRKQRESKR